MIITRLQWDRHSGPDAVGQHKLTFTMDESLTSDFDVMRYKKGTQFTVVFIESGTKEEKEFSTESSEETKERFRKHMNSLINSTAELLKKKPEEFREEFKKELKFIGLIGVSTKELEVDGYAKVITLLKQKQHDIERN